MMIRIRTVLPEAGGPYSTKKPPAGTLMSSPSSTVAVPYCFDTPPISRIAARSFNDTKRLPFFVLPAWPPCRLAVLPSTRSPARLDQVGCELDADEEDGRDDRPGDDQEDQRSQKSGPGRDVAERDLQKRGDDQERQADAIERQALPLGDHHQPDEHHRDQDALDLSRERHSLFDGRRCVPVVHRYTSPRTVPKVMPTSR